MTDPITPAAPAPVAVQPAAEQHAFLQPVQEIDAAVRSRAADRPLTNWWLAVLLISPVTFGIYGLVLFFQRIGRIDSYISRKRRYYAALVEFTGRYAVARGQLEAVRGELEALNGEVQAFSRRVRPIGAGLSFLLCLVTLGLWGFVVLYRLNASWNTLQLAEQHVDARLSVVWQRLGMIRYPIGFTPDPSKDRNYWVYLLLTVATLGIWGIVWDYKIHTDPDTLYPQIHSVEDIVLQVVRAS